MCVCTYTLTLNCLPAPSPFPCNICILNTRNIFKYSSGVVKSEINQHVPLKTWGLISKGKLFSTKTILNYTDIVENLRGLTWSLWHGYQSLQAACQARNSFSREICFNMNLQLETSTTKSTPLWIHQLRIKAAYPQNLMEFEFLSESPIP